MPDPITLSFNNLPASTLLEILEYAKNTGPMKDVITACFSHESFFNENISKLNWPKICKLLTFHDSNPKLFPQVRDIFVDEKYYKMWTSKLENELGTEYFKQILPQNGWSEQNNPATYYMYHLGLEYIKQDSSSIELLSSTSPLYERLYEYIVFKDGMALEKAPAHLRNNFRIAVIAVNQNSRALEYVSPLFHSQLEPLTETKDSQERFQMALTLLKNNPQDEHSSINVPSVRCKRNRPHSLTESARPETSRHTLFSEYKQQSNQYEPLERPNP